MGVVIGVGLFLVMMLAFAIIDHVMGWGPDR